MADVKLIMFKEDGQRKDIRMGSERIIIGRKEDCDLRIPLAAVSRRHCEINKEGDSVTLNDLGSSNGTFLNNKRVQEANLKPGDHIVIGPVVFTVQINGKPEHICSVRTSLRPGSNAEAAAGSETSTVDSSDSDVDPIAALDALGSDSDANEAIGRELLEDEEEK